MTEPIRITLGGYQGPESVHTRGLIILQDELKRLAGDKIEVVLKPNVAVEGHRTADLPSLVEDGQLDGCYISSSYLADRIPCLSMFDMPFAMPSRDLVFELLDGALGSRFAQDIKASSGLVLLGIWDNGIRHMSTADRPLRDPKQCRGLTLRTLPNSDHQRVFRSIGFDPVVIDAKDLSAAVSRGEVDAQENPLTNTYNFGLHKTLPTITLTGHLMGIALFLFNREKLLKLPNDIQEAIKAAVSKASKAQRELAKTDDHESAAILVEEGAQMVSLTAEERANWLHAVEHETARSRARLDTDLLAILERGFETERTASV